MRHHWGLGIGHTYSHNPGSTSSNVNQPPTDLGRGSSSEQLDVLEPPASGETHDSDSNSEGSEIGFDNRQDDWLEVGVEEGYEDELDDDTLLEMDEMYGHACLDTDRYHD